VHDTTPAVLYHYTCRDRLASIRADRELIPQWHPLLGNSLVWLTDLAVPDKRGLGLTADHLLTCDRTEARITVYRRPEVQRWTTWARKNGVSYIARFMLEGAGGAFPMHWWISPVRLPTGEIRLRPELAAKP
jgi:hypothetical protein